MIETEGNVRKDCEKSLYVFGKRREINETFNGTGISGKNVRASGGFLTSEPFADSWMLSGKGIGTGKRQIFSDVHSGKSVKLSAVPGGGAAV